MRNVYILVLIIFMIPACKRSAILSVPSGNLLVANAVVGGGTITLNPTSQTVGSNSWDIFPLLPGQGNINLSNNTVKPAIPYYQGTLKVADLDNYSLFLGGASQTQVDAVLIKESYHNYDDSVCGVRFINLSPNSNPISVNLAGSANGSEVASLAYKSYSDFKQYPATQANASYVFEIRDVTTGNAITTYTYYTQYFHNVTIILGGLVGGAGITQVVHP